MSILSTLSISASGMTAERLRMDVVADNLANVNTTRTQEGGPFRRHRVVFEPRQGDFFSTLAGATGATGATGNNAGQLSGVHVAAIEADNTPARRVYDPGHPDAGADGYVNMPNISTVTEMVDMMSATRAYEANVASVQAAKQMAMKALDIARV
jgi:flagellar basal-body rod protein FlgC